MKKIFFRVDSANHIGNGHLSRCHSLANELLKNNCNVTFILSEFQEKNYIKKRRRDLEGFDVEFLPIVPERLSFSSDQTKWLPRSQEEDAIETMKIIKKKGGADLLIIDHYSLDIKFESFFAGIKRLVIEDGTSRKHECEFLIDGNTELNKENYTNNCSLNTKLLLGEKFSLVSPEFYVKAREINKISRVLIYFGGSDFSSETSKIVNSINNKFNNIQFTVLLSADHKDYKSLKEEIVNRENFSIISDVKNMSQVLAEHDFFLGSLGYITWERIASRLPGIAKIVAQNQEIIYQELSRLKMHDSIIETDSSVQMISLFDEYVKNKALLNNQLYKINRIYRSVGVSNIVKTLDL